MDRRDFLKIGATAPLAGCSVFSGLKSQRDQSESQHIADVQDTVIGGIALPLFLSLSGDLTGEEKLNVDVAADYLQLLVVHPEFGSSMPRLMTEYQRVRATAKTDIEEPLTRMFQADADLWRVAEQIIYLWYVAALYVANPLPSTAPKNVWQPVSRRYADALVWRVLKAHAPSTYGGPYGHWEKPPR